MKKNKIYLDVLRTPLVGAISILFVSCGNSNEKVSTEYFHQKDTKDLKIDQLALSTYFQTNQIVVDTLNYSIEISIENSQLIEKKKEKMGTRWDSPEPWISVAATHQASTLAADETDSIIYNIKMHDDKYRYGYSVKQLKKSNNYISTCEQLATYLNSKDYFRIKELLSSEITDEFNDIQLRSFIQSTFGNAEITKTELIGTKIIGTKYSFYLNFWNNSNQAQTYAFTFLEDNDKIAGIQMAK